MSHSNFEEIISQRARIYVDMVKLLKTELYGVVKASNSTYLAEAENILLINLVTLGLKTMLSGINSDIVPDYMRGDIPDMVIEAGSRPLKSIAGAGV